jgi:hypothetical protein
MRYVAYISILIGVWLFGMAALMLGVDGLLHPPFVPVALISGAYFGAITTVCLAEEVAEAIGSARPKAIGRISGNRTGQLPCPLIDHVDGDWRAVAPAWPSGSFP